MAATSPVAICEQSEPLATNFDVAPKRHERFLNFDMQHRALIYDRAHNNKVLCNTSTV